MNNMKCGTFIIIGKPNVGKSTLFNLLLKEKISGTSNKAHTTKHVCINIIQNGQKQIEYIDTRGYDKVGSLDFFKDANAILLVTTRESWGHLDIEYLDGIKALNKPVILLINKVDTINGWMKEPWYSFVEDVSKLFKFQDIYCISAKHQHNISLVEKVLDQLLVDTVAPLPPTYAMKDEKWRIKEIIREKLFRTLNKELPHQIETEIQIIDQIIYCTIVVRKTSQRRIIIGNNGLTLGRLRTHIEKDLINIMNINKKLELFVKVL